MYIQVLTIRRNSVGVPNRKRRIVLLLHWRAQGICACSCHVRVKWAVSPSSWIMQWYTARVIKPTTLYLLQLIQIGKRHSANPNLVYIFISFEEIGTPKLAGTGGISITLNCKFVIPMVSNASIWNSGTLRSDPFFFPLRACRFFSCTLYSWQLDQSKFFANFQLILFCKSQHQ